MKKLIALSFILLTPLAARAQDLPPGKWWLRPEIVQQLSLTREQQNRLEDVFRVASNDLIDAKADVEKLQIALRSEIDRSEVRRQEVQKIAANLSAARGRLFERELMMLVDMRQVLSTQQWDKMRGQLEKMHGRGPGGPGAGPGGPRPRGGRGPGGPGRPPM